MFLFTLSMSVIENADMVLVVNKLVQQYFCSNCIYLTMLYYEIFCGLLLEL